MEYVLVNGIPVIDQGKITGALPVRCCEGQATCNKFLRELQSGFYRNFDLGQGHAENAAERRIADEILFQGCNLVTSCPGGTIQSALTWPERDPEREFAMFC